MPKYLIKWNAGYGEMTDVAECASQEEADNIAYESWREAAESNADYAAEVLTQELAEDHGIEWDEPVPHPADTKQAERPE